MRYFLKYMAMYEKNRAKYGIKLVQPTNSQTLTNLTYSNLSVPKPLNFKLKRCLSKTFVLLEC